jgi:hypothetical protein
VSHTYGIKRTSIFFSRNSPLSGAAFVVVDLPSKAFVDDLPRKPTVRPLCIGPEANYNSNTGQPSGHNGVIATPEECKLKD